MWLRVRAVTYAVCFLFLQTTANLTLGGEDMNRAGSLNLQLVIKMLSKKLVLRWARKYFK